MSKIRSFFRALMVSLYITFYILFIIFRGLIMGYDLRWAVRQRQNIARGILKICGIKLETKGTIGDGFYIFVSNHKSYLDPVLAAVTVPFVPVAKAEVSNYPILGYGIKMTGIMWVKRESKSSRQATRVAMAETLDGGDSILIYPEGTTHGGETTKDFKLGVFRIAADKKVPIIPIALDYKNPKMAWTTKQKMIPHLLQTIGNKTIEAKIEFGEPILGGTPEELLEKTQSWIDKSMLSMRKDWTIS